MRIRESNTTVIGNIPVAESVEYRIDQSALSHIMTQLSDLYSDRPGAVVRETITNALDSHTRAGHTGAIDVRTPNLLASTFEVQDYGTGMSLKTLREVVTAYGSSTKREDDVEAGQLGFGFKAPFSISNQFTVVTVCDGEKVTMLNERNIAGTAEAKILSVESTDEPNGTTVIVPIEEKDRLRVRARALEFAEKANSGMIRVDGELIDQGDDWVQISDTLSLRDSVRGYYGEYEVIMGNVAYPIEDYGVLSWAKPSICRRSDIRFKVPMGSVSFPPSRETLRYDSHTEASLETFKKEIHKQVQEYIDEVMSKDTHLWEKIIELRIGRTAIDSSSITKDLPNEEQFKTYKYYRRGHGELVFLGGSYTGFVLSAKKEHEYIVLTNCALKRFTVAQARRVNDYLNGTLNEVIVLDPTLDVDNLLPPFIKRVDWEEVKKVTKPSPKSKSRGFSMKSFEGVSGKEQNVTTINPKEYRRVFYMSKSEVLNYRQNLKKSDCIVFVPPSKVARFLEHYPDATYWYDFVELRQAQIKQQLMSSRLRSRFNGAATGIGGFLFENADRIENEEFLQILSATGKLNKWRRIAKKWGVWWGSNCGVDLKDKYPLIPNSPSTLWSALRREHIILYINSLEEK